MSKNSRFNRVRIKIGWKKMMENENWRNIFAFIKICYGLWTTKKKYARIENNATAYKNALVYETIYYVCFSTDAGCLYSIYVYKYIIIWKHCTRVLDNLRWFIYRFDYTYISCLFRCRRYVYLQYILYYYIQKTLNPILA